MKAQVEIVTGTGRLRSLLTAILGCLFLGMSGAALSDHKPNHGGGGNPGGGTEDPIFTADSADPMIPPVDSYSLDRDEQIVFRTARMDLAQFGGMFDIGGACNHGFTDPGTLVLKPKSNQNPAAVLEFWFQSALLSGDTFMHRFYMEGDFEDLGNWPPSVGNPTTLTFKYWEVAAENKKAQKQDCAGESKSFPDLDGPWTVTVSRQP